MLVNASHLDQSFALPAAPAGAAWRRRFDTAAGASGPVADHYPLVARSFALLEA
jgi:hypothetical protein